MKITEIRIKLMESSEDRLRAFCSITIDDSFVVRDLKIIDGTNGPFVAMPSRKLTGHCGKCNHKNHLRANYCNNCGGKTRGGYDGGSDSHQKLYADVAHPINSQCREDIQKVVIDEFSLELERASQPGYRSRYDDDFQDAETDVAPAEPDVGSRGVATGSSAGKTSQADTKNIIDSPNRSASAPPPPHFMDDSAKSDGKRRRGERPRRQRDGQEQRQSARVQESNAEPSTDGPQDDSFGAGIFDN